MALNDLLDTIVKLNQEKVIYLYTEPEVIDFTIRTNFNLVLMGKSAQINFPVDEKNILEVITALKEGLFSPQLVICCWKIKNLFSAIYHWTKKPYEIQGKIIDIRVLEAYMGNKDSRRPVLFDDVIERLRGLIRDQESWAQVYKKIHLPLIKEIVPQLENAGIIDSRKRKVLFAHYEVEGQKNGRFKCPVTFEYGFNPHNLDLEQRQALKPRGENMVFMLFDFKFMEVSTLQWLSQDENLRKFLENGEDFYKKLFKLLTGRNCDQEKYRDFSKQIFLPVVFGMTAKTISEKFNFSNKFARHIIDTLNREFSSAMSFVQSHENQSEVKDYLGRVRRFEEHNAPQIRNFVIQSPASTVCFEKLIGLKIALQKTNAILGFHVHDGYCLYVPRDKLDHTYVVVREILENPSELLPGLKLKVSCKTGPNLDDLMPYGKESKINEEERSI